jgi:hypothetical protein
MSELINDEQKDLFVEEMIGAWNDVRNALDARVPDVTMKDLPDRVFVELQMGVDTQVVIANMLTAKVAELEGLYPQYVNELRVATEDVRVLMYNEAGRRKDWHEEKRHNTRMDAGLE